MIEEIKKVCGFAGRDKSYIYSNVIVKNGMAQCQDQMCGITLEVETDLNFCCDADRLKSVLSNCDESSLKMSVGKAKLSISSGKFKASIKLVDIDTYPFVDSSEDVAEISSSIVSDLHSLSKFTDPSDVRLFAQGVNIDKTFISATNGHVAVKKVIDSEIDSPVIIPTRAIDKMASFKVEIDSISTDNIVILNFSSGYFFTKTIDSKMVDVDRVITELEQGIDTRELKIPIAKIASLCDNKTIIVGKEIKTLDGDASIDGFDLPESAFNSDYLLKIFNVADLIDLSKYPGVCPFAGEGVTGAISGIRI